jgi:hypothetical protein
MKKFGLVALIVLAGALIAFAPDGKAVSGKKQTGVVEFSSRVKLRDIYLSGKYLFVHDDERMARGEPCTEVYEYKDNRKGALVIEFHCKPVERTRSDKFFVRSVMLGPPHNLPEIREYQFGGSAEGHQVPK